MLDVAGPTNNSFFIAMLLIPLPTANAKFAYCVAFGVGFQKPMFGYIVFTL